MNSTYVGGILEAMKPKTISVRDQDLAMWERFAEIAAATDESRASVSKMIASAMADYLDLFGEQGYGLYVQAQGEALDWEHLHRRGIMAGFPTPTVHGG